MASKRLDLTPTVVKDALKLALKGSESIVDFCDRLQPYLVLRVRGHVASWLIKTRVRTLKIGDAMPSATSARIPSLRKRGSAVGEEFLGLREAREKARREWAKIGNPIEAPEEKPCWTWGQLVDEYRKFIAGMREDSSGRPIYPSTETQSDVRQIFGRMEVAQHSNLLLSEANEDWFEDVQKELHEAHNYDAYRKFRAYGSAALNWAASYRRKGVRVPLSLPSSPPMERAGTRTSRLVRTSLPLISIEKPLAFQRAAIADVLAWWPHHQTS